MRYYGQKVKVSLGQSDGAADIRLGWGKGEKAVTLVMTPAQARQVLRDLSAALQQWQQAQPTVSASEFNRIVGQNIKRERAVCQLTAEYVAKAAGLSKSFLSDLERGKRGVSSENLVAIARAVGCRLEDLLKGL